MQAACINPAGLRHPPTPPPALLTHPSTGQMAGPLVTAARDRGVIVITAGKGDIVRLVPPLIVRCGAWGRRVATDG